MTKENDPQFAEHVKKLMRERGVSISDVVRAGVSRSTVNRARRGFRPERQASIESFAKALNITPQQFISPLRKSDWVQPDVCKFTGSESLRVIDGAVELHYGPEREGEKYFWHIDDVQFEIEDHAVRLNELKPFENLIKEWEQNHPDEKRGMKYCVTEVVRRTTESSSKLKLRVRPIEYHLAKPINDMLASSYESDGKSFEGNSESHEIRQKYFGTIPNREDLLFPNILTAQLSVITSDNKLILCKRRKRHVDSFQGCWSASLEEGFNADWRKHLKRQEVYSPLNTPDMDVKSGFLRALREELNLSKEVIAGTQIQALSFIVEFVNANTVLAAIARVPVAAEEIIGDTRLQSSEEADCFAYCPFDMSCLLPTLLDKTIPPKYIVSPGKSPLVFCKDWKWHPTSRMRIFWSLANEYGLKEVLGNVNRKLATPIE